MTRERAHAVAGSRTPYSVRVPSALWETSAVLLFDGPHAVAIDPCISQAEIEAVRTLAEDEGAEVVAVLATHADWDHVAGIASFPAAEAAMGPLAAAKVASGAVLAELRSEGAPLGLEWPGEPRCDRVLRPGRCEQIGPFAIETLPLPGHTDCGLGFRLREPDLLVVGDYLSPLEAPFVYFSTAIYRATLAALIDLLEHDPPASVIPGHGRPLGADEARAFAVADLAYLHALREAAAGSLARDEGRERAIAAAIAVPPPRSLPVDAAEVQRNAELQYEELVAC
jgi:glyoxylase-like metal-dependent hydrolase (beta-lactamase superfamily II)